MKRIFLTAAVLCFLLSGCSRIPGPTQKQYTATFLTLFDTVTTIVGYGESEEAFQEKVQPIHDHLEQYHRLFDIYHEYDGISNLKTINDQAGVQPVKVDAAIIEMLMDCKAYYEMTNGMVNAAMGSVLQLWHEARNEGINNPANAAVPEMEALKEAALHMDFAGVEIDEQASTVYITDPKVQLDVGAIAKGWATQKAAQAAQEGMLISVGGNVCATGPKDTEGTPWVIGIQDPDATDKNLHTLYLTKGAVVTSGDYQRTYVVEGKPYHHIIDPQTLMPSAYWRSVTIVCEDSGLADALSTALFLMPYEQGKVLVEECGAEAFWVDLEGKESMTSGFQKMIRT